MKTALRQGECFELVRPLSTENHGIRPSSIPRPQERPNAVVDGVVRYDSLPGGDLVPL
jgi:hypothetical protein